jgi:hypothetical protein
MRPTFESPIVVGLAAALTFGIGLLGVPTSGSADSLHIFCWGATSCASNATPNLQTNTNPPQFGVTDTGNGVTPGTTVTVNGSKTTTTTVTDDLIVDILDPTKTPSPFSPSALSPFSVTIFKNGVSTGPPSPAPTRRKRPRSQARVVRNYRLISPALGLTISILIRLALSPYCPPIRVFGSIKSI